MAELEPNEIEAAKMAFEVLGDGKTLDSIYLGKFCYCLQYFPSIALQKEYGATDNGGEKMYTFDEVLVILTELKKNKKELGCYEDFVECLKTYDKEENGMMLVDDLTHCLMKMGEKITEAEMNEVYEECLDEEDEDGLVPYVLETPFFSIFKTAVFASASPKKNNKRG